MVLLLDEVDAIAKERGDTQDVGELKRIVNGLLQALDFHQSSKSILISATNHQRLLDEAIWRRFDEIIEFPLPASDQVKQFLTTLLNGVKIDGIATNLHQPAIGLSFAQMERVTIDVIKTMILEDRKSVRATELSAAFKSYKVSLASARKQVRSKSKTNE
jgi:AAA+ superfamily predicted ATPase